MRFHSLDLTDLNLVSYQSAQARSGKKRKRNGGEKNSVLHRCLRTMVEVGGCLMAGLRRARSWDEVVCW